VGSILWGPNSGPQTAFLASTCREVLYGGAVGGGKTDALLLVDARFASHPGHRSIYLRRTRPQLQEAIDRTLTLYPEIFPGAVWQEGKSRWELPSGAIFQMGYAEHEKDIMNYKSFQYNVVKFDELTSFTEHQYKFMMLRNRTNAKDLPLWIRSGTNPGDVGHEFVYNRFIKNKIPYRVYLSEVKLEDRTLVMPQQFIPSSVFDNPKLANRDDYIAGILQGSEEDIAAYLYGDWDKLAGAMFTTMPVELPTPGLMKADHYVVRGFDFGLVDHTAVYWLVVYDNGQTVDIAAELYINKTQIDDIAHLVLAKDRELQQTYGLRPVSITAGSPEMGKIEGTSGQSLSTMFATLGVPIEPVKGIATKRTTGWAQVQRFLQNGRLRYWPGACPHLLRTLPLMIRNPANPNDLKPKQEDHAVDALRYGLMTVTDPIPDPIVIADPRDGDKNFDQLFAKQMASLQRKNNGLGQFF
jgi:hypothetical protein